MIKKASIIILLFILTAVSVTAQFSLDLKPVENKVLITEAASFDLEIRNERDFEETYRIYTLQKPEWDLYTAPGEYTISTRIPAKSSKTLRIFVDPVKITDGGTYNVNIRVRALTIDVTKDTEAQVTLQKGEHIPGEYVPTVIVSIAAPEKIDPREAINIDVDLNNQNPLDIQNLIIKIEGNLIDQEMHNTLGPKERKTVRIPLTIPSSTPPQKDTLSISILRGNETIVNPIKERIEVIGFTEISEDIEPLKGFLRIKKGIAYTNKGNIRYEGSVLAPLSWFRRLFTSTDPKANVIEQDGKNYLSWEVSLEPGATFYTIITENYALLVLLIILAVIAGILYIRSRSPILITKTSTNIEKKEGGISVLKILINIQNRAKIPVEDIDLSERIPDIVILEKEVSLGSLQPTKVLKHEKKGMLMKWQIDKLEPGEERVIAYKIRSKLPILGGFVLPPTTARFRWRQKPSKCNSTRLNIGI